MSLVINIGDFADAAAVIDAVGEEQARELLTHAEAGQFSLRSWHFIGTIDWGLPKWDT